MALLVRLHPEFFVETGDMEKPIGEFWDTILNLQLEMDSRLRGNDKIISFLKD